MSNNLESKKAVSKSLTLSQFLEGHRLRKNDKGEYPKDKMVTHTILGETPAQNASFHIPEDDTKLFFDLYGKEVLEKKIFGLIERHTDVAPIIIDIDLKFSEENITKNEKGFALRQITSNHIKKIVGLYMKEIEDTFTIIDKEKLCAFVFERPTPYKSKDIYKDGLHIMFPHIVSEPWAQFFIRDNVLAKLKENNVFEGIKYTNPMSDVIDRSVIDTNGWYMFGSTKPKLPPYELKYIFDRNVELVSDMNEVNFGGIANLPYFFSIRRHKKNDCVMIQDNKIKDIEKIFKVSEDRELAKFMSSMRRMQKTYYDITQIGKLIDCLSDKRADDERSWMEVGWCLHNIDKNNIELLQLWVKFSKRSDKFKEGECEKKWARIRNEGNLLTIGSLYYWAKTDNYDKYIEIKRTDIRRLIDESLSCSNVDVTRVLYEMYKDQYKFVSTRPNTWYEFRDHRWYIIEDGIALRKKISTDLVEEYCQMISNYNKARSAIDDDPSIDANEKEKKIAEIDKKNKLLLNVVSSLKNTSFKEKMMKEARDLFYDEEFLKKLDENEMLVCFNNGVLDLNNYVFRNGAPDDYISISTNIDYIELDKNSDEFHELDKFLRSVFREESVRHYTLKFFSSLLQGFNKDEKFHLLTGASGANGKSKTNELLVNTLGDYAGKFNTTLLTGKRAASNAATPELAQSKGKRYMYLEEPSDGERMNIGMLKEFSGGDKIKVRGLYSAPVEFKPQFKMALICNDKPKVSATDGGSWRRLVVVEFTSRFVENPKEEHEFKIDLNISSKLKQWRETFAALLVEYHKIYKKEGLKAPPEISKYTNEYQKENDMYAEFFNTRFTRTDNMTDICELDEVYDEYKDWISTNNPNIKHPSKKEFREYIAKRYSQKHIDMTELRGFTRLSLDKTVIKTESSGKSE